MSSVAREVTYGQTSMQSAVCIVQCVGRCVMHSVKAAELSVQCTVCSVQREFCSTVYIGKHTDVSRLWPLDYSV